MKKKILKRTGYVLGVILVSALVALGAMYFWAKHQVEETGNVLGVSWYNETEKEFAIDTVDELYEFARLSTYYNFKGQTIRLEADLVKIIDPAFMSQILTIEIKDKMIYIPSTRFTEYQRKISKFNK